MVIWSWNWTIKNNPEEFEHFSVGDLIQLPREIFVVSEMTPYQPKYECF